jgi:hypothetical protein
VLFRSRAVNGNVDALKKLKLPLDQDALAAKDLGALLVGLANVSKGQASAAANTFSGRLEQLRLRFNQVADKLGIVNTVLIYDNEPRNKEIVNMVERAVKNNYRVVIWPNNVEGKDINEMIIDGMTESEIKEIIDTNTFSGLRALTEFTYWKKL